MPILSLMAKLGLDKSGFDAGMDSATKSVNKFGNSLKGAIAGAFGIAALKNMANAAMENAHEIQQLANKYSLTTDEVQLLKAEADKTGQSFGELTKNTQELEATLERLRGGDVLFSRQQIDDLNRAKAIIDSFKGGVQQEMANLIENPSLMGTRLLQMARFVKSFGNIDAFKPGAGQGPDAADSFLEKEAAEKRKAAEAARLREDMIKRSADIQKQADDLAEKNRIKNLSTEERITELVAEREKIFSRIATNAEERAQKELDLRKNEAELQTLTKTDGEKARVGRDGFPISESAFGRIGAFTGAASLAALPPGAREQIAALQEINRTLTLKGIIVKDVKQ